MPATFKKPTNPKQSLPQWEIDARLRPAPKHFTSAADKADAYNHFETHGYFPEHCYKPTASRKMFNVEQFTTVAAFVVICLLIGAGLAYAA